MKRVAESQLASLVAVAAIVICTGSPARAEGQADGTEKAATKVEAQTDNVATAQAKSSAPEGNERATQARLDAEAKARAKLEAVVARLQAIEELDAETAATLVAMEKKAAASAEESQRVATWIAERSGLSLEEVMQLRAETGAGWGEIFLATALAAEAEMDVQDVFAQRAEGAGWGKIAKANGMQLGAVVSDAAKAAASSQALGLHLGSMAGAAAGANAAKGASVSASSASQAGNAAAGAGAQASTSVKVRGKP